MNSLKVLRHEIKYKISSTQMYSIKDSLKDVMTADRSGEGYMLRSLYFDSINDIDYYEKLEGAVNRKKIRLRVYDPKSDMVKLELKAKHGEHQLKESLIINKKTAMALINCDYDVLLDYNNDIANKIYLVMRQNCYVPRTIIEYKRIAFVSPSNTRVTLDYDIRCSPYVENQLFDDKIDYLEITNASEAVLEVKFDHFLEDYIRMILSKYIANNESFSKYAMGRNKE